jgi:acetyltransferase-like isoleucine patch superfamily enzyme
MSLLQRSWGTIPMSPKSKGFHLFSAFWKRILHCIARYFPLLPAWRVVLHKWRGVRIGKNVFIGAEVFIDDADPSLVRIEDNATIIAQSTLLGHAYYPNHFSTLLKTASQKQGTLIRKGAYLGLRTTVLPGVTIGEYSIIGAGSLVTKDVPPFSMAFGVPAKVVKTFKKEKLDRSCAP